MSFFIPEMIILSLVLILLLWVLWQAHQHDLIIVVRLVGVFLGAAAIVSAFDLGTLNEAQIFFGGFLYLDNSVLMMRTLLLASSFWVFIMLSKWLKKNALPSLEFFLIFSLSLIGVLLTVCFQHWATLFLMLELMSLGIYLMISYDKSRPEAIEAGLKYLLFGGFSLAFLLMGLALLYGQFGVFDLAELKPLLSKDSSIGLLGSLGFVFLLLSLMMKTSLFPFHFWTMDVYQGAALPLTAFMSVTVKSVLSFVFLRFFRDFHFVLNVFSPFFEIFLALSFIVPALGGLNTHHFKRLMAYSSMGHAAFFALIFFNARSLDSFTLFFFYAAIYILVTLAIFQIYQNLEEHYQLSGELTEFHGLGWKQKGAGLMLSLLFLSLAGIPISAGFFAKFLVLKDALGDGEIFLVLSALGGALLSFYFYFKTSVNLFMKEPLPFFAQNSNVGMLEWSFVQRAWLSIICMTLLVLSFFPQLLWNFIKIFLE